MMPVGQQVESHLLEGCRDLLSSAEREQADRFSRARPRELYILAHALVRVLLSGCHRLPPRAWQFDQGRLGKPRVAEGFPSVRFNLTHTRGLVACAATARHELGIDAEYVDPDRKLEGVMQQFSASERAALERLSPAERAAAFFETWTLKEAYAKACGSGLTLRLDSFSVAKETDGTASIVLHDESAHAAEGWRFFQVRPESQHRLAICVQCPADWPGRLVVRRLEPAALLAES